MNKISDEIEKIRDIVSDSENIKKAIADDIIEIKSKYGSPRKSKIINPNNTEQNSISIVQILNDGNVIFS
jgi:DNA gyrase/topoisomerase IV subunit A